MDLSLVSMDDIIAELDKRFDTVVLLTNKIVDIKKSTDDINYHFKDKLGCLGLIRIADEGIKNSYRGQMTDKFEGNDMGWGYDLP